MKKFLLLLSILFIGLYVSAQTPSPKMDYSDWLFVQSDKSLQYRIAVEKQEGDIASLRLQFRVNNEDPIHCKSAACDGILLSLSNKNVGDNESTHYSFVFEKSFIGINNIYTWPTLITTELKTWPDGSKRFLSKKMGIVYTLAESPNYLQDAVVPYCCVDVILAGRPNEHRCGRHGYNAATAIIVK